MPAGPAATALRMEGGSGTNTLNYTAPTGATTTIDLGASGIISTVSAGNPVTFAGITTLNEVSSGAGSTLTASAVKDVPSDTGTRTCPALGRNVPAGRMGAPREGWNHSS